VLEQQLVALPEGPDTRPLLDVTLRAPAGGRLHVISTHLVYAHYYGDLPGALVKAARARRVQVQRKVHPLMVQHRVMTWRHESPAKAKGLLPEFHRAIQILDPEHHVRKLGQHAGLLPKRCVIR
jgi:hypothetical protein